MIPSTPTRAVPDLPRDEIDQHLKSALRHIHDYVYLQKHPLASLLSRESEQGGATRAQQLRRFLLEEIERLAPAADVPIRGKQWRGYHILTSRYVEGHGSDEIMRELAISERQYYREHQLAMQALTDQVWQQLRAQPGKAIESSEQPADAAMASLSNELERISRTQEPVELTELIEGVLRSVQPLADERGVALARLDEPATLSIITNRTVLRQVFIQILSALLVVDGLRRLNLRLHTVQRRVWIIVEGLAPDYRLSPQVHELEERLAQARYLVGVLRGKWGDISSQSGRYVIQVGLPTGEPRVLLAIEDNPSAVQLLRRYLARQDFRIVHATCGSEALAKAHELLPDVITLDIMLPSQDGWEILQELKGDPQLAKIPIILASVLAEPALTTAFDVAAYLKKPYSQTELLDVLERVLGPSH